MKINNMSATNYCEAEKTIKYKCNANTYEKMCECRYYDQQPIYNICKYKRPYFDDPNYIIGTFLCTCDKANDLAQRLMNAENNDE
jgi:hypothetical protein